MIRLSELPVQDVFPGFHGRMVHAERMTLAFWTIDAGAPVPEHAHPHEQVVTMLEGRFELLVDGAPHRLGPGEVFVIPGGARHSGRALTDCRILDVFAPVREDYRVG